MKLSVTCESHDADEPLRRRRTFELASIVKVKEVGNGDGWRAWLVTRGKHRPSK